MNCWKKQPSTGVPSSVNSGSALVGSGESKSQFDINDFQGTDLDEDSSEYKASTESKYDAS